MKWSDSRFRTVTNRLALRFIVAFGLLGVVSFAVFNSMLSNHLRDEMHDDLMADCAEITDIYEHEGVAATATGFSREAAADGVDRVVFVLFHSDGEVLAHAGIELWPDWPKSASSLAATVARDDILATQTMKENESLRIIVKRLEPDTFLMVGKSTSEIDELLHVFRLTFGVWLCLVIVVGSVLGWFVAQNAMAGVKRVTQTAGIVADGDLSRRVPVGNEGREIETLAESFNGMLGRIEALVSELQQVTHDVAHDLRSPLTRMRVLAELTLRDSTTSADQRELAIVVIEECDRLVAMINTSLEIAETNAMVSQLNRESVDLDALLSDAVDLFGPLAEVGGVTLAYQPLGTPVLASLDRARIQRAVANILDNAIKYSPVDGRVTITLSTDSDAIDIHVADTGIGIDASDLPHVFDRYFRSEKSRGTVGNGLGLSLSQAIISAHGGEIRIESQLGAGSTVHIHLPCHVP